MKGAGGEVQSGVNRGGPQPIEPLHLIVLRGGEVCGMRGVAVKCIEITQHPDCEGRIPAPN